jgi:hypothetical protein
MHPRQKLRLASDKIRSTNLPVQTATTTTHRQVISLLFLPLKPLIKSDLLRLIIDERFEDVCECE